MSILSTTWAILRQRCPRCRKGPIFRSLFQMNDPCPACGLVFQREEGYFLGSMYVSYVLSAFVLIPCFILVFWLFQGWNQNLVIILVLVPYLPLMPLVFSYSRVIWIYFDRWVSPSDISAGPYEKMRQAQGQALNRTEPPT